MPDVGKRVVLGDERDGVRVLRTGPRTERGLQPADAALYAVAGGLEERRDGLHSVALVVRQLRVGVDVARQPGEVSGLGSGEARHGAVYCPRKFPLLIRRVRAHLVRPPTHSLTRKP